MIELTKIANQWADGEDSVRDTTRYSPRNESGPSNWREGRQKKKPRYNGNDSIELVAAGFETPREDERQYSRSGDDQSRQYNQGQFNRSGGSNYRGDGSRKREWQRHTLTPEEELEQPCKHHMFRNPETGKWGSRHLLKDCKKARRIYQAMQKIVAPQAKQPALQAAPAAQPVAQLAIQAASAPAPAVANPAQAAGAF